MQPRKKIGIDARFYGPIGKGLGRYTQEVVDGLTRIDSGNDYVIFLRKENFSDFVPAGPHVKKVLADVTWYGFAEQVMIPYYIWREKLDLIHFPHFNVPIFCPIRFIVTVHDLILIHFPTRRASTRSFLLYHIKNLAYRLTILLAIRRSKAIITVSEFTKKDILDSFKVDDDKIAVTFNGVAKTVVDSPASDDDKKVILGYNITKPYLLYVGNVYPHKNLDGLLEALSANNSIMEDIQLVLVGKEDYFYSRLMELASKLGLWTSRESSNKVIFAGYVPDNELAVLYRGSLAYIFPSFYEGFGIPPLEAMSHGAPVLSSDRSSMPEILGDAALYFDPSDKGDMIGKIGMIISDDKLREDLSKKGFVQAAKYRWENCIQKTFEVYKKII